MAEDNQKESGSQRHVHGRKSEQWMCACMRGIYAESSEYFEYKSLARDSGGFYSGPGESALGFLAGDPALFVGVDYRLSRWLPGAAAEGCVVVWRLSRSDRRQSVCGGHL